MAGKRASAASSDPEWKHLVAIGGLLAAVAGTLILGWILEVEPGEPAKALPSAPMPVESDAVSQTAPPVIDPLTRRAETDLRRLRTQRDRITLQFMMACDPQNIRPLLQELASEQAFFVVPTLYHGQTCYRVCWGTYLSREEALDVRNLPAPLAALTDPPQPKSVALLLE